MKKSQSAWMVSYAETEQRIRQDEREKLRTSLDKVRRALFSAMTQLDELCGAEHSMSVTGNQLSGPAAPKRKAVAANATQVALVHEVLSKLDPLAVTAKALKGSTGLGLKTIGSALRDLVGSGLAVEAKRGFFKAKRVETKEDGDGNLDSTDAASR